MWILEISIVLIAIFLGLQLGGIGLGVVGGAGLFCLYLLFGIVPVNPPFEVALIIIAIVLVVAILDSVGSLDLLTLKAASLLKNYPTYITFISPAIIYFLVFFTGTGHVIYSLLPIIARLAKKYGIRPERPLVASVIASQQAIIASPFTGATSIIFMKLAPYGYSVGKILLCLIPASIVGTIAAICFATKQGKDISSSLVDSMEKVPFISKEKQKKAKIALFIFALGILLIAAITFWQEYNLPKIRSRVSIAFIVAMVMLSTAALILFVTRTSGKLIADSPLFRSGIEAVVALLGVSWMSNSFLQHHLEDIKNLIGHYHLNQAWQWALILFAVTVISTSQGATLQIILPLLLSFVDLSKISIMAILPAANSVYLIPTYPPIITAAAVDTTGTTRTGRMLLDHSFLIAGVLATFVTCITSGVLQYYLI